MKTLRYALGPLISGILFAIGLGVSGMTEARYIIGFLDVFGDWQGQLILVMGGALVVYAVFYRLIIKGRKPLFEAKFSLPSQSALDRRLIFGAILFGLGWGLTGLCPGPGLVALVSGQAHAFIFVATMLMGMWIGRSQWGQNFLSRRSE